MKSSVAVEEARLDAYSVVISSTGRYEYLRELIASIERQTFHPQEVIILLDNNDMGLYCAANLSRCFPSLIMQLKLLDHFNLSAKRNYGAKIASSEILMYSDDDDLWAPIKAECVLKAIASGSLAVCHNYSCFGNKNASNCNVLGRNSRILPKATLLYADNIYGGGSTISCVKSLVSSIPFDEKLLSCEDLDWWRRVQFCDATIFYDGRDLVSYRRHGSNMGSNRVRMANTLFRVSIKSLSTGVLSSISGFFMILKAFARYLR